MSLMSVSDFCQETRFQCRMCVCFLVCCPLRLQNGMSSLGKTLLVV
jgi:hypothetical protein